MVPDTRLAPVVQHDVSTLGRLFTEAFNEDHFRLFIFSQGPDLGLSIEMNTSRIEKMFAKPSTRFVKAIDDSTGEIVGFITWTMVENQHDEEDADFDPPLNREFNQSVFGGLVRRRIATMKGKT